MGERTSASRLGRDTLIYGVAFLVARAASFVMLPIYTRYLVPADYAALHLLQMSLDVAAILLSAGVTAGVQRFYFKADTEVDRCAVLWCSLIMFAALNALGALALWVWSPEIAAAVLEDEGAAGLVHITAMSFGLEAFTTVPMLLLQIRQRPVWYAATSIGRLTLQVTLNVVFLVGLGWGVRGILLSTLITYAAGGAILFVWFVRTTPFAVSGPITWELWKFGYPYQATGAGTFILTYVDRYFLTEERGLTEVGIYSLAYQFGFLLMYMGPAPFHLAWDPQRFQLASEPKEVRDAAYARGYLLFSALLVTIAVGIAVFAGPVIRIMADASYHSAAGLVPLILLAFVCQAFGHVEEFGIQVAERTLWTTVGTWISVGVIVVGYSLLIPPYGAYGAAMATVIAYTTRWICFRVFAQRLFPVDYRPARGLRIAGLGAAVVCVWLLIQPSSVWLETALACGVSLLWVAIVWWGVLSAQERASVAEQVRARLAAMRGSAEG